MSESEILIKELITREENLAKKEDELIKKELAILHNNDNNNNNNNNNNDKDIQREKLIKRIELLKIRKNLIAKEISQLSAKLYNFRLN